MSNARNLSKFKPSSSGLVETADIADDAINADKIADNAVTTDRIADDAVTTAKVNPAQTDITSVGTLSNLKTSDIVGIGQASPTSPNDATAFLHIGDGNEQDVSIVLQDAVEIWEIYQNDDLSFRTDTTNIVTMARTSGDVTLSTGNLIIGTAGKGIDFSAQTHATSTGGHGNPTVQSEILDHYEEGEYNYGMNVNMVQETNANYGRYTRVGNLVTVNARMDIASVSGSNTVFFANLPFAVSAHTGSGRVDNLYIGTLQTYNVTNGGYDVMGKNVLAENSSGTAYAMYSVHNGNHAYILNSMVSTSSELYMTLTYRCA